MITSEKILDALRAINDPDLNQDIVTLGFVKDIAITNGDVRFTIELTTPACPVKEHFKQTATKLVSALPGVTSVQVNMTANVRSGARSPDKKVLQSVKNIIAIASGKGGVGKSTLASNLACALHQSGATVGLLDADIYGPSIPKMLGTDQIALNVDAENNIIPWNQHGIKLMSMGFLVDERTPVIWRGPMVNNILSQFLKQVAWGALDYLLIDLPPGTGDAQLTITQMVPLTAAVIITTPQEVAIQIACKGLQMFGEVNVPIIGIVENMSYYTCAHCHDIAPIFRRGGTQKACELYGTNFLGEIPIDPNIALDGDAGVPTVLAHPDSPAAQAYREIAGRIAAHVSVLNVQPDTQQHAANLSLEWK